MASVSSRYPRRWQRLTTAFSRARSAAEQKPDHAGWWTVGQPGNHCGSGDVAEWLMPGLRCIVLHCIVGLYWVDYWELQLASQCSYSEWLSRWLYCDARRVMHLKYVSMDLPLKLQWKPNRRRIWLLTARTLDKVSHLHALCHSVCLSVSLSVSLSLCLSVSRNVLSSLRVTMCKIVLHYWCPCSVSELV